MVTQSLQHSIGVCPSPPPPLQGYPEQRSMFSSCLYMDIIVDGNFSRFSVVSDVLDSIIKVLCHLGSLFSAV